MANKNDTDAHTDVMADQLESNHEGRCVVNDSDQAVKPHKESNDDKGSQDSYKNTTPEKQPNQQPEQPMKEQK